MFIFLFVNGTKVVFFIQKCKTEMAECLKKTHYGRINTYYGTMAFYSMISSIALPWHPLGYDISSKVEMVGAISVMSTSL